MLIYDEKLKEKVNMWHGYKLGREKPVFTEEHIAMIALLAKRVADARSCSTSEGFTWEEYEIANLLETVYAAGYNHAIEAIKTRLEPVNALVNSF